MPKVPYWEDVESSDTYINASLEEKLLVLDGWEKDRYAEMPNLDPVSKIHFEASVFLTKERLNNPDATEEDLLQGLARRKDFESFDHRNRLERTRKRDARIHANSLGKSTYLNKDIIFNDVEKSWVNENNLSLSSDWAVRRGLDEADPEDFEVNYALAALGREEFTDKIRIQDSLSEGEKNKVIANFSNYEGGAFEDLFGYMTSKILGTSGRTLQSDSEDDELDLEQNPMFLTPDRLREYREKGSVEAEDMDAIVDNLVVNWASKKGLDRNSLLDKSNPAREKLKNLYKDSLLEHREVWQGGEVARQDSQQNWILNKKWAGDLSLTEEDVRTKVKESGLDIPKNVLEAFVLEKNQKDDTSAQWMLDQVYMTFEDKPGFWTPGFAAELYRFVEANKDKDWSPTETVREYQKEFKGTGIFGKAADLFESAAAGAAYVSGDAVLGAAGTALNMLGFKAGEEMLGTRRQAQQSFAVMDRLSGNKWGRIIGGELTLILATMGAAGTARGLTALTRTNVAKMGRNTKRHQAVGKRLDDIANNLENGDILNTVSRFKEITNKIAGGTYSGLQASRSATGTYSDSYFMEKDRLMAEGMSEEDASALANKNSILPSLLSGGVNIWFDEVNSRRY